MTIPHSDRETGRKVAAAVVLAAGPVPPKRRQVGYLAQLRSNSRCFHVKGEFKTLQ